MPTKGRKNTKKQVEDVEEVKPTEMSDEDQNLIKKRKLEEEESNGNGHNESAQNGVKKQKEEEVVVDTEVMMKNMHLKTIIKENHGKEIHQIAICTIIPEYSNLVATVGDTQTNVYDNRHFGNHLDLMLHFINKPTEGEKAPSSLTLRSCCWMKDSGSSKELKGDAYLAIAGDDKRIQIISIKRTKVITILKGHTDSIVDVSTTPQRPQLLVSVARDGTVRLWDVHAAKQLLHTWNISAYVAVFNPAGDKIYVGGQGGAITEIDVDSFETSTVKMQDKKAHSANIDCIKFLNNNLVTKSTDGRTLVWDPSSGNVINELKVPNASRNHSSRFDISTDGKFICAGNAEGVVHVYKIETGKSVNKLEHKRSKQAVRACLFSPDTKNILYVTNDPHIWRFDYLRDPPKEVSAEVGENKENENTINKEDE